ncbi:surface lipoprotein assembly modifier [Paraglaciecola hydrolytica]|uniref:Surface lipoprotein assembly modifier C-terminal domain-containing protein n=1 Tax=Paraglaciecola hydrolytica TaxID=1799789 RepID=A0A135ZYZ0_9ALTE|nr:surface lipoprotein assembly modifier [Paraglaciecola hydrolytica]KXI28195.1 hypothetical protein AX660_17610 [Paraglaciecola hydrolytica]
MKNSILFGVVVYSLTSVAGSAEFTNAKDAKVSFAGQASAGWLHNSSLVVAELDKVAAKADNALFANLKFHGKWQVSDKLTSNVNYQYSRKDYQELNDYDLDIHQFGIDAQYDFSAVSVGLRHDLAKASLAGEGFLDLNISSVYLAKFINPELYVRGALNFKDKKFAQITQRDADNEGVNVSVFQFFQGGRTMLSGGLSVESEDAIDSQYDYDNWGINTKASHKFDMFGVANQVQLSWRYQASDYQQPNNNNELRADSLINYEAQWQIAVHAKVNLVSKVEHGISHSTLDSLNYTQTVGSLQVEVNF